MEPQGAEKVFVPLRISSPHWIKGWWNSSSHLPLLAPINLQGNCPGLHHKTFGLVGVDIRRILQLLLLLDGFEALLLPADQLVYDDLRQRATTYLPTFAAGYEAGRTLLAQQARAPYDLAWIDQLL